MDAALARAARVFMRGAFLFFAQPTVWTLVVGAIVALPGLGLRAWASGHLKKNESLATTGPYAFTRNPLYLGSFIMGLGFTIAAGRAFLVLIFIIMILGIYLPVMRVESRDALRAVRQEISAVCE